VDYLTFVSRVLDAAVQATGEDYNARLAGVNGLQVLQLLDLGIDPASPEFWASDAHSAYNSAADRPRSRVQFRSGPRSLLFLTC